MQSQKSPGSMQEGRKLQNQKKRKPVAGRCRNWLSWSRKEDDNEEELGSPATTSLVLLVVIVLIAVINCKQ